MKIGYTLVAVLLCGQWGVAALGQERSPAEQAFAEGLAFHREAETVHAAATAADLLRQAMERYQQVVALDPRHCEAQSMWTIALTQLAELEKDRRARAALVNKARSRILMETTCPTADHRASQHWATFLLLREFPLVADPVDQLAVLREAREALETALRRVPAGKPAAEVHGLLGDCLTLLSEQTAAQTEQESLREAAREHYEAALRADPLGHASASKRQLTALRSASHTVAGAALQRQADALTNDLRKATALWREAIQRYQAAVEIHPTDTRAHHLWAISLARLCRAATESAESRQLAELARERFAIAARLPEADVNVHEQRGVFLLYFAVPLATNQAYRSALLVEAREAFTNALRTVEFSGQRARLSAQLGLVLVELARERPPAQAHALLREALTHFESTQKAENLEYPAQVYDHWGVALLRLGQLDRNTMLLHQAAERFQTALEYDPNRHSCRYNLACVYALLNQPNRAVRHLRRCLDHDTNGVFRAALQSDPDLAGFRETAEYRTLFEPAETETGGGKKIPSR